MAFFGASTDQPEDNRTFAHNLELPYPLLSDPTRETARAYGVLKGLPVASRHTIYISKEGKVLLIDTAVNVDTAGTDILKHLQELGVDRR